MSYRLHPNQSVIAGVRRAALEQIDKALAELDGGSAQDETAHQVRKRCKKLRGLIRLVRPAFGDYRRENQAFRDLAGLLAGVRDVQAMLETYDDLAGHYDELMDRTRTITIRHALEDDLRTVAERHANTWEEKVNRAATQLAQARKRVEKWELDEEGFAAIRAGLVKTYGRACGTMRDAAAKPDAAHFHEWRKRAKYHWHHLRLLQDANSRMLKGQRDQARRLSELLGDAHDLAVFAAHLSADRRKYGNEEVVEGVLGLARQRRGKLESAAHNLGTLVLAEKPKHLAQRLGIYWEHALGNE